MLKLFKHWFRASRDGAPSADEPALRWQREVQALQLELQERDRLITTLKSDLDRQRTGENTHLAEAVQAQIERVLTEAAIPVAQLLTQAHLLEAESKPVRARDVLTVARRLVRIFQDEGLELEGRVGDIATFAPTRHEPLSGAVTLRPGQKVVLRFVGVSYRGKVLRRAGVEPAGESACPAG
jgi:hypothetical protein